MKISTKDWLNYIKKMSKLSDIAGKKMQEYVQKNGFADREALIDYAHALVTKYGEGSAELACQMYDAISEMEKAAVSSAIPADVPSYNDVAKAINGAMKQSPSGNLIDSAIQRMVKLSGADTTLKNALRDKTQFAWIPHGDTCAFCIAIASRGWQNISSKNLKNGHAEHIHSHCDCQYAIRHDISTDVEGYNPQEYVDMYYSEEGTPEEKINAMRRKHYAENRDKIKAQKRAAYAINKEARDEKLVRIPQFPASEVIKKVESGEYSLKLSKQQYDKHVEGTKDYERYKESRINKGLSPQSKLSISYEESVEIIEKYSGTGIIRANTKGDPMNIEDITCNKTIGYYMQKGEWIATRKAALHHGSKGTHIVPQKGNNYD